MSCIYCDYEGYCTLFSKDIENDCCSEEGVCCVCDDPDPSYSCENYEGFGDDEEDY